MRPRESTSEPQPSKLIPQCWLSPLTNPNACLDSTQVYVALALNEFMYEPSVVQEAKRSLLVSARSPSLTYS